MRVLGLVCAAALLAPPAAAKTLEKQRKAGKLLEQSRPEPRWPALEASVTGLLITTPSPWGIVEQDWGGQYVFAAGTTHPWFVYFEAPQGVGKHRLKNWSVQLPGGKKAKFDAAQFDPTTPNSWGLNAHAHLVELEVNRGAGAGGNPHFVITNARVIGGDVAAALDDAQLRWQKYIKASAKKIASELAEAAQNPAGKSLGKEREEIRDHFFPTWLPDEQVIRVTFVRHIVRVSEKRDRVTTPCRRGNSKKACPPPNREIVVARSAYAVEIGMRVEIAADGTLTKVTTFAPSAMTPEVIREHHYAN